MSEAIVITRNPMQTVSRPDPQAWWIYYYSVDGAAPVEFGTCLGDLRDRLRKKFPGATIAIEWSK